MMCEDYIKELKWGIQDLQEENRRLREQLRSYVLTEIEFEVFAGNYKTGEIVCKRVFDTEIEGLKIEETVDELTSKMGFDDCVWAVYSVDEGFSGRDRLEDFGNYLKSKI